MGDGVRLLQFLSFARCRRRRLRRASCILKEERSRPLVYQTVRRFAVRRRLQAYRIMSQMLGRSISRGECANLSTTLDTGEIVDPGAISAGGAGFRWV